MSSNVDEAILAAGPRPGLDSSQADKKNYGERLSRNVAQSIADALRSRMPEVLPDSDGRYHESRSAAAGKPKKLDVNYSTPEFGLGLGVSVKTINFRDRASRRYTKNQTRVDNELRAEAMDYHLRQPYAVLGALVLLPFDSVNDGSKAAPSSYGSVIQTLRRRTGRATPADSPERFELLFVGLYDPTASASGAVFLGGWDAAVPPPIGSLSEVARSRLLDFSRILERFHEAFERRNGLDQVWFDDRT